MKKILDGSAIHTEDDFHVEVGLLFEMGPYYGRNLDALWDRLSTDVERPATLVWTHSATSHRRLGPTFDRIVGILERVKRMDQEFKWADRFEYELDGLE